MIRPRGAIRSRLHLDSLAATLVLVLGGLGCHGDVAPAAAAPVQGTQARRYVVRGEVIRLPSPSARSQEVFIRHEPIDDFADSSGRVVGMASMTMPFPMAPLALAAGLAVGDKVELRFMVDWTGPTFQVEHVEKLPHDTRLRFGPASPLPPGTAPPPSTGSGAPSTPR